MYIIFLSLILSIISITGVIYLFIKPDLIKIIPKKDGVFLQNIKPKPDIKDIEESYILLEDLIETIKLEDWEYEVDDGWSFKYIVCLTNTQKSIKIECRIEKGVKPRLSDISISHSISFYSQIMTLYNFSVILQKHCRSSQIQLPDSLNIPHPSSHLDFRKCSPQA